jgi:cell division protease FtsH
MPQNLIKNFVLVLIVFLALSTIYALFFQPTSKEQQVSIGALAEQINQDKVKQITVSNDNLSITYQDGTKATAVEEPNSALSQSLLNYGADKTKLGAVNINFQPQSGISTWLIPLLSILPVVLFFLFFYFLFRQARTGAMQTFDFTRARASLFGAEGHPEDKITFKDVAGLKEAKEELKEIVDFLKNPKKYLQIGARIPRGVLLLGPAGVGKTLLARAVAGEANVPFFHTSGSTFVELFVGVGASRVRDLFATAKRAGRAIIFIDELDAIGRVRGSGIGGGHDEREQTLNQILVEMDGFERDDTRVVMAATNRPDVLDPALLRPGRFDRKAILDLPDINDREEILKIHCRGKPLASDVDLREVAERTPGFSGADLANVVNEAAILAARRNKNHINQTEFLESVEKVLLGPERKSHILSKKEKEIAAYHEAGHALVSSSLPEAEPVRKISIVARGMAAGYTLKMPTEERKIRKKSEFLAEMATLLGGYCAEKIKFHEITTGASNDLKAASDLARRLIKEYGMSSLGPVSFGEKEELVFLGKEISEQRNYSEEMAAKIDKEVSSFIDNAQKTAEKILKQKKPLLEKIAKVLIEKETIEKEEFESLMKGGGEKEKTIKTKNYFPKVRTLKIKGIE